MKTIYNKWNFTILVKSGQQNSSLAGHRLTFLTTIRLLKVFALFLTLTYSVTNVTAQTKTRVIGAANWNTASTWIQYRTGNAACTFGSSIVTGTGTLFLTELQVGDNIMTSSAPGTVVTVASIQSNTSLTLTVPAIAGVPSAPYGRQRVPGSTDNVEIGNTAVPGGVTVTLDVASATISSLTFIPDSYTHTLTHAGTNNLTINGPVTFNQPLSNNYSESWEINAGSATVSGLISFLGSNNFNRKMSLVITSGTCNANGGITFSAIGTIANKVIDMSGGAGTLNLKGALTTSSYATLTAGTAGSIFNYADNGSAQTINFFGAGAYNNLHVSNTNAGGATLSAAITTANVTGNLRVLSGTLYNGGFAIALNNSVVFEVANTATFKLTGSSGMVTGTSITKTFGATGTVDYNGSAQTVSDETYGHLTLSTSGIKTMPGTPMVIQGNFTLLGTASATALNSLTIGGSVILNSGITFAAGSFTHNVAGSWTNNGGTFNPGSSTIVFNGTGAQAINGVVPSQTFNNLIVLKSAGTLLTVNSTTTLRTNDFTETSGNFTASFLTNITGTAISSLTLSSGTFTAGAVINITGDWINNGGVFTPGVNTVIFNGNTSQIITGTSVSQTFNNITLAKPPGTTLSTSGSTTTLTVQNITETSGDFTTPATLNINGNRILTTGVYTAGATTYVTGDWTNNGGTFVPGTGTVIFNGTGAQAINGTMASQAFYNVIVAKTAGTLLSIGGITTTLTINDLTETTGNFTAPTTLNINGNLAITAGTFTAGATISIQGSWTKNGGTFTSGSNLVNFIGTGTQTIGGSSATSFYDLTINTVLSSDIVQLTKASTVKSVLSLTKGVLELNGRSLTLTSGLAGAITRTNGYILSEKTNNSSQIIWKIGNNTGAHTYPFGTASGSYIPFTLDLTAGDIGNVTVSTYPTAANNTPYPNTPIAVTNMNGYSGSDNSANAVNRFWQIDKDGASGTATLTFTATNTEVGTIMFPTAQRWRSAQNPGWEEPLPGQTSTATSVTVPGVTTFSPWTLSSSASILPIELLSFMATLNDTHVDLDWSTASELNNDYFTIEKTLDFKNYETVAIVDGAGNSIQTLNYFDIDQHPYSGISYYRLKQTDFDGSVSYSNIAAIDLAGTPVFDLNVSPNPTRNKLNVAITGANGKEVSLVIVNAFGRECYSNIMMQQSSNYTVAIDLHYLPGGEYLVALSSGNIKKTRKLLVQ